MDMTLGVILLLVTGFLWVTGAILHWHNIKRQERLLARMRRMAPRRTRKPAGAGPLRPEPLAECLHPAKRWTVG